MKRIKTAIEELAYTREEVAYHEAGHAVMAYFLGVRVLSASIQPEEGISEGHVLFPGVPTWVENNDSPRAYRWLEYSVRVAMAGPVAYRIHTGTHSEHAASSDSRQAVDLAYHACGSTRQVEAWLHWLHVVVEEYLSSPMRWKAVEAVAAALLKHKRLSGRRLRKIIQESLTAQIKQNSPAP